MSIPSVPYFLFLGLVFLAYWPLSRFRALSLGVVLFANYFFYARYDLTYLFLIPAASTADFLIGLALDRSRNAPLRRLLVSLSLVVNLGMLVSIRYTGDAISALQPLAGQVFPGWQVLLPLGLSFYAFQSLTYTLDIYRRDAKATTSYLTHLTAVSFFPTTLAGPITRVSVLISQFSRPGRDFAEKHAGKAFFLIGLGAAKKLLIADYLGENLVNRIFDFPALYSAAEVALGVVAYAFQLYYDFSGYTDIALGSALLLGIQLPANFKQPYLATDIADFWRRWHISLSNWLRDYLYFSLPGLRSKWKGFTYLNLVITMTLGGIWHGPSWNFAIWGLLHGSALAVTRWWQTRPGKPSSEAAPTLWMRLAARTGTFSFVCLAWVFFRADSLDGAMAVLRHLGTLSVGFANLNAGLWVTLVVAVCAHFVPERWYGKTLETWQGLPALAQAATLVVLAAIIQFVASTGSAPFIYQRF
ncbi:MAG: MBOAT family protein [Bryobacterales bacterium]|jgi:D-alanyl-lipoteichoic acid acyltransferase DltB (MBOAT superfamily)|nr:MBOAT family protein [Bryobacterales bacterium]